MVFGGHIWLLRPASKECCGLVSTSGGFDSKLFASRATPHPTQDEKTSKQRRKKLLERVRRQSGIHDPAASQRGDGGGLRQTLSERLKERLPGDDDPIPQVLLRKYIAYARQHAQPVMSDGAAAKIKARVFVCVCVGVCMWVCVISVVVVIHSGAPCV